jgi:hypothetical protein
VKKILLALILVFCANNVYAHIDTADQCKVVMERKNVPISASNPFPSNSQVPDQVKQWGLTGVAIGNVIGDSLVATAGKLGVEVNKFASTSVGELSIALIVFQLIGTKLIHIIFDTAVFTTGMYFSFWLVRFYSNKHTTTVTEYTGEKTWYGRPILKSQKTVKSMTDEDAEVLLLFVGLSIVITVILTWIIL